MMQALNTLKDTALAEFARAQADEKSAQERQRYWRRIAELNDPGLTPWGEIASKPPFFPPEDEQGD